MASDIIINNEILIPFLRVFTRVDLRTTSLISSSSSEFPYESWLSISSLLHPSLASSSSSTVTVSSGKVALYCVACSSHARLGTFSPSAVPLNSNESPVFAGLRSLAPGSSAATLLCKARKVVAPSEAPILHESINLRFGNADGFRNSNR
jgi:hypothetical protein